MKIALVFCLAFSINLAAQVETKYDKSGEQTTITRYHDNGAVKEVGSYINGQPHGHWVEYDVDGNILFEANYNNGQKEGKWFRWDNEGATLYELVYVENELIDVRKWKLEEINRIANN